MADDVTHDPTPDDNDTGVFRWCPGCGQRWHTRGALLADPEIELMGYSVNYEALDQGLFLFSHDVCHGTVGVEVAAFVDLHEGPVHAQMRRGSSECPGFCDHEDVLSPCQEACRCAFVRDVLTSVAKWNKGPSRQADGQGAAGG